MVSLSKAVDRALEVYNSPSNIGPYTRKLLKLSGFPMPRYQLENRYQDSGWETLNDEQYHVETVATKRARMLAKDVIAYGMVRVVDTQKNVVIITIPAGGD